MSTTMRLSASLVAANACTRAVAVHSKNFPVRGFSVTSSAMSGEKVLNLDNLNPRMIEIEYAVRGALVIRALEIDKELQKGAKKPFNKVIGANIGDAHAMGQKPITFIRQVLACVSDPSLIESGDYPKDVKERATLLLSGCGGKSVGAYTTSTGIDLIRKHVAEYIERRDGHPADYNNIFLSTGASAAIKSCLQMFINTIDGKPSGIMVPIPQYPLYSASLSEYGLKRVGYYLDEENNWGLSVPELERALQEGSKDSNVRAIVVINPGNPTGQVLTRANIEDIVKFAHQNKLFIFADEVYQDNVYDTNSKFFSFKKVTTEMGAPYSSLELASFMSVSKGYSGECGLRGGWAELCGLQPDVQAQLYKTISTSLCSSVLGQCALDCVAKPPVEGEPSYELWHKERTGVLEALAERAKMVEMEFNAMEGFTCNVVQGAMYAFPQFKLPPKAIEAAKKAKVAPDMFYARQLLEETGICIVPGSGFAQKPGTYHFRTTILPQTPLLKEMLSIFKTFHAKFTQQWN